MDADLWLKRMCHAKLVACSPARAVPCCCPERSTIKPTAIGRILFWRGGSLWIGRAGEPAGCHAHHGVQISLPFASGRVQVQAHSEKWKSYAAAIVAPEQPHAFEAPDQWMAQIFVEPESRRGRELQTRFGELGIAELDATELRTEIAALEAAYEARAGDETLIDLAKVTVAKIASGSETEESGDPRVSAAIEMIRAHLGKSISLAAIAAAVHLSPDRFRHLSQKETGGTSSLRAVAATGESAQRLCHRQHVDRYRVRRRLCRLGALLADVQKDVRNRAGQRSSRIAVSFKPISTGIHKLARVSTSTYGDSHERSNTRRLLLHNPPRI